MLEENYVKNCPKETVAVGVEAQELATQTTLHHTTGFLPDYQLDTTIDNSSYSRSEGNSTQVPQTQAEMLWLLHQELTQTAQGPSPLQQLPPEMLQPLLQQLLPLLQRSKSKFCVKENRTHTPMGARAVEKVASEKTNQAKAKVETISKQIEQVQNETDILLSRAIHLEQELGRKPTILGFLCQL